STHFQISLQIFRKKSWSLLDLQRIDWAPEEQLQWLRESYLTKKSMLIIGNTGSGKTSLLNALLRESPKNERCLIIEDTDEIQKPNNVSSKLIARIDQAGFENIDLGELLKQSLRMRPDRIVLGEVRGSEAKNLILALSSGHTGSLTTIHAENAAQSLLRLEILIQMGAPTWSLQTIRKLILLGLDYIITLGSNRKNRTLHSIHKIQSLENNGFTLTTIYQNRLSKNKYI
ncbi:MAG: Flp pilus assembly complex ATPase component TadA, partial [Bdellovibrionales bacterium]|nr:Flp pilus assembly complex ATPase component TadA [Bdellovibrionales bacterium]